MAKARARSPARRGFSRSRSTTPRRVGSARADRVRSMDGGGVVMVPLRSARHALDDPPGVSLRVDNLGAAIGPVLLAVVGGRGLDGHLAPGRPRAFAERVDVVDVD